MPAHRPDDVAAASWGWEAKALFDVPKLQEALQFRPFDHRRDSRVEVIAPPSPPPDWDAGHAAFEAARIG